MLRIYRSGTLRFMLPRQHFILHVAKRHFINSISCEGILMKENKLMDLSMDFAVKTIELVKRLKEKKEAIISNQIGRSGTSIGANIREAQYAHGKPDFIAKLQIALKEANETGYWLELLRKTDYIEEEYYGVLEKLCTTIRVTLIASINTAKGNKM